MRQIIEILRLKHEHHLSIREIARSCGIASSTVGDYLLRAEAAGLKWPLPEGVGEAELETRLSAVAPPRTAGNTPTARPGLGAPACRTAPSQRHPAPALAGVHPHRSVRVEVQPLL
jgi:hypothetical protein